MWFNDPYFEKVFEAKNGIKWYFKVWYGDIDKVSTQKIFFWDENKDNTGLLEFKGDQTIPFKKIKDRILKLIKNTEYRNRFLCQLKFPIESYY